MSKGKWIIGQTAWDHITETEVKIIEAVQQANGQWLYTIEGQYSKADCRTSQELGDHTEQYPQKVQLTRKLMNSLGVSKRFAEVLSEELARNSEEYVKLISNLGDGKMPVKFKKGDLVWCWPLGRMAVLEARQWLSGLTLMYKVEGCAAWFTEEQLAGKDTPMFREASANGASQPDGIRLTEGSYERGDGSMPVSGYGQKGSIFKVGQTVWDRKTDRMTQVLAINEDAISGNIRVKIQLTGEFDPMDLGWRDEEELVAKDIPMFRAPTAPTTDEPELGISPRELGEALLESGERNKRELTAACREVFSGSTAWVDMERALKADPLKWIELLARFQRERLDAGL